MKTNTGKNADSEKRRRHADATGSIIVEFQALALCPYAEVESSAICKKTPSNTHDEVVRPIVSVGAAGLVRRIENAGSSHLRVGDEVWTRFVVTDPSATGLVTIQSRHAFSVPVGISLAQAATLGDSALMALVSLCEGNVRAGQRVLIHGAANPFGSAAIALAAHMGAHVMATVDTNAELAVASAAGVKHVAVVGKRDAVSMPGSWAGQRGFDVVLDPALTEHMQINTNLLAQDGVILTCSLKGRACQPRGYMRDFAMLAARSGQIRFLSHSAIEKYDLAALAELINSAVTVGRYRPLVGQIVTPAELDSALVRLARGRVVGNLVLQPATHTN